MDQLNFFKVLCRAIPRQLMGVSHARGMHMPEQLYFLLRKNPMGEIKACGLLPQTREDAEQQARELRAGELIEPGVTFFLQPLNADKLEV